MKIKYFVYTVLGYILFGCSQPSQERALVIWVTAGLEGEWGARGDFGEPKAGGMLHISRALERYRQPGDLLVDLGRFRHPEGIQGSQRGWRIRGKGFLNTLARLEYTAFNVSFLDLGPWPPDLAAVSRDLNLPLISSNIGSDTLLFKPFTISSSAGRAAVKIFGLGGGRNEFLTWAASETVDLAPVSPGEFTILLTDASYDNIETFLSTGLSIDLVLWLNDGDPTVEEIGLVPVLGIGSRGTCIGRIEIRNPGNEPIRLADSDLSSWLDGKPYRHHPVPERLFSGLTFWRKFKILRASLWAVPSSMTAQKDAHTQMLQTSDEIRRLTDLEALHRETKTGYAGPGRCSPCHARDHSRDLVSAHQLSDNLSIKSYPVYEYCLPCHATGFDDPEGFLLPWERPDLLSVSCEACHGPAYDHVLEGRPPYPSLPGDDLCLNCHRPEDRPSNHPE
jgi:hypothetical protein